MCRKRFLFVFALLLCLPVCSWAQDSSWEDVPLNLFLEQPTPDLNNLELNLPKPTLNGTMPLILPLNLDKSSETSATDSTSANSNFKTALMTAYQQRDSLELLDSKILSLSSALSQSNERLVDITLEVKLLKQKNAETIKALESNCETTGEINLIIGELSTDVQNLERKVAEVEKSRNTWRTVALVGIPVSVVVSFLAGIIIGVTK